VLDNCSESGLIILELLGDPVQHEELQRKLNLLQGVHAGLMKLSV